MKSCLIGILLLFMTSSAIAWDAHFLLTYVSLKNMATVSHQSTVPAETLTSFLKKEKTGLVELLRENEIWAQKNIPFYPPLPPDLVFKGDDSKTLKTQFIEAIRVNPRLKFPLFVQYPPHTKHRIHAHPLARSAVMLPGVAKAGWIYLSNPPLEGVSAGEKLSPLEIIATAADEPDYGMDINLWEDSPTEFGKKYQWGTQPFGAPALLLSSQGPFHMAFYHESWLLYKLGPFLKHSYLTYRFHLYMKLSQYAFRTNHPYWGYRFLGWSLHYAQDLAQPYHSTAAPGASMIKIIGVYLLDSIGFHSVRRNFIQLISNRHYTLEDYTYHILDYMLKTNEENNIFIQSLTDQQQDSHYPAYTPSYLQKVIAKESYAKANSIDRTIQKIFPKKYVADPNYVFYKTEPVPDLFAIMKNQHPNQNLTPFNKQLATLLRALGAHTRNITRYALKTSEHRQ